VAVPLISVSGRIRLPSICACGSRATDRAAGFQNMELRSEPAAIPAKAAPNPDVDCSRTPKPPASAAPTLATVAPATATANAAILSETIVPLIIHFTTD
jgi:hypothetical protein